MTNSLGILYDDFNEAVQVQVIRDLMILSGEWDLAVYDPNNHLNDSLLAQIGLTKTQDKPTLYIVYKCGDDWPEYPHDVRVVKRDMKPSDADICLNSNPLPGYFLREQGRDGSNRTELYLNRTYPKGNGVTDPLVTLNWS